MPFMTLRDLYEINNDPGRKKFLDELSLFMLKRRTPIVRLPVMGKQTLDLFELYNLVCERGGLVEVTRKRMWQAVADDLDMPSTITRASFTLKKQYIRMLYPFERETRNFETSDKSDAVLNDEQLSSSSENNLDQTMTSVPSFSGFDQTPSSVLDLGNPNSVFSKYQREILIRHLQNMEDQKTKQQVSGENDLMASIHHSVPMTIKREREDDEHEYSQSKTFRTENVLTPPISNSSDDEDKGVIRFEGSSTGIPRNRGMNFNLETDENGQLTIHLRVNGVRYEGALQVVS